VSAQASGLRRIDFEDGVWADVERDFYNPVIKRREITLKIHHVMKPTPMRINIRLAVAEKLGVPIQNVYVRKIDTEYGVGRSTAIVHVYDNTERALLFEPKYVVDRNGGLNPFEEE
jgi:small subunit ribosomal protein S24e